MSVTKAAYDAQMFHLVVTLLRCSAALVALVRLVQDDDKELNRLEPYLANRKHDKKAGRKVQTDDSSIICYKGSRRREAT